MAAVTVLAPVALPPDDTAHAPPDRAATTTVSPGGAVSLVDAVLGAGLWLVAALVVYACAAYVVLFYLPPADRLPNGAIADAAFLATAPLVLAVTWLAAARSGR